MDFRTHRRTFLQGAMALGVSQLLPARLARADGAPAKNLVLVYHPNGLERGWEPAPGSELRLGSVLEPFAGLEPKMTVLGGMKGGIQSEPFAHSEGMPSLWTGTRGNGEATVATHSSVDQRVAQRLSGTTALPSLELGVQSIEGPINNANVTSYDELGRARPPEDDPRAAFTRLFGAGGDPAAQAEARRRRGSILDYVRGSVGRVRDLYGAQEGRYLDAHLEAIRSVELRIQRVDANGSCGGDPPAVHEALYDPGSFPALVDLQSDLVSIALSCGATRVVNLQLAHSTTNVRIPGVNPTVGMHQVMHERTPAEKRAINRFFIEKVARLVRALDGVPGTGGGTLLDDSLVVWGTEMSIGNHGNHPIPFFLFGAADRLQGGRHVEFDASNRPRHTRLLETIGRVLDLGSLGRFGTWSDSESSGVLEEVLR